MALRLKVLSKKVQKFERRGMQNCKLNPERVPALDAILNDVFDVSRPKPHDYDVRKDLVRIFNEIAREIFGKSTDIPIVEEFGSFVMDLFNAKSDLDLSFNFTQSGVQITREKKIQTLRKLAKKFYALQSGGHVYGVHPITTAKVPILKVVDRGTGVECDISIENRDGILKSQLIRIFCSIDERFRKLSFLMKTWAKAQKINSSKDGTLNSLSIIQLVAFHLQTRNPPILPPFSALFKDGTDPASVAKLLSNFVNYGKSNKESVAELLVSLLMKLSSVEKLWPKGLCASVYEGSWTSKTWASKVGAISVEDFTDRSQNVSRAVAAPEVKVIYECIHQSIRHLFAFMDGQIDRFKLGELLFGQVAKQLLVSAGVANSKMKVVTPSVGAVNTNRVLPPSNTQSAQAKGAQNNIRCQKREHESPADSTLTKKMRYSDGWSGTLPGSWGGTSSANWVAGQQLPHFEMEQAQKHLEHWRILPNTGWGGTQQPNAGGWNGTWQTQAPSYHAGPYSSSSSNQLFPASLRLHSVQTNPSAFGTSWPSFRTNLPPQGTQQSH
ncbi:protein HESO1-like isoform X2 [Coffea eugenioides]|uniref:protein HESO1-like isoform X2 n=1 Tax=Coffea eugenioides TaxID=49369 RepID=UPI000F615D6A|nr:protein HESO1-like isoform X2 [Coffea eugenioides]